MLVVGRSLGASHDLPVAVQAHRRSDVRRRQSEHLAIGPVAFVLGSRTTRNRCCILSIIGIGIGVVFLHLVCYQRVIVIVVIVIIDITNTTINSYCYNNNNNRLYHLINNTSVCFTVECHNRSWYGSCNNNDHNDDDDLHHHYNDIGIATNTNHNPANFIHLPYLIHITNLSDIFIIRTCIIILNINNNLIKRLHIHWCQRQQCTGGCE